jgi:hypothetical protein
VHRTPARNEFKVSPCELDPKIPRYLLQYQQKNPDRGQLVTPATVLVLVVPEVMKVTLLQYQQKILIVVS